MAHMATSITSTVSGIDSTSQGRGGSSDPSSSSSSSSPDDKPVEHPSSTNPAAHGTELEERPSKKPRVACQTDRPRITYKSNDYSVFSLNQQEELLRRCLREQHSRDVLELHGYFKKSLDPMIRARCTCLPHPSPNYRKRAAIVLDCEMVRVEDRRVEGRFSEVVQVRQPASRARSSWGPALTDGPNH